MPHQNQKLEKALDWIVSILRKHEVPYQITGGFAAHLYGSNRPVNDIDIDIPEESMELLLPAVENYIAFGPSRFLDERWDLKLMTLNYFGQEIDIGGAFETKIYDDKKQTWIHCPAKLDRTRTCKAFGLEVPVIHPQDLIAYKRLLTGPHQKIDIEAVQKYLTQSP